MRSSGFWEEVVTLEEKWCPSREVVAVEKWWLRRRGGSERGGGFGETGDTGDRWWLWGEVVSQRRSGDSCGKVVA